MMYIWQELLNITQPILLAFLMDFFDPCSTMPAWKAWLLASGTVLAGLCSSIIFNNVSVIFFTKCNGLDLVLLPNFHPCSSNASCLQWSYFSKSKYHNRSDDIVKSCELLGTSFVESLNEHYDFGWNHQLIFKWCQSNWGSTHFLQSFMGMYKDLVNISSN